jgi:hypothetical protein
MITVGLLAGQRDVLVAIRFNAHFLRASPTN